MNHHQPYLIITVGLSIRMHVIHSCFFQFHYVFAFPLVALWCATQGPNRMLSNNIANVETKTTRAIIAVYHSEGNLLPRREIFFPGEIVSCETFRVCSLSLSNSARSRAGSHFITLCPGTAVVDVL